LFANSALLSDLIWENECNHKTAGLIAWNRGEEFPSLGIGHFIWYGEKKGPYEETFPLLIAFFQERDVSVPEWLQGACPFPDREALFASPNLPELQHLLQQTIELQAEFIVERFWKRAAELGHQKKLKQLSQEPGGLFALIDYSHFKGFGTSSLERYQTQGWGLLQVLDEMEGEGLEAFIASCHKVLSRRIELSPPEKQEGKWLTGWKNRVDRYRIE
jgi:hypothetical protein